MTEKIRNMTVKQICLTCKKPFSIKINSRDYHDWREGKLIQSAFPYLSACDREILISQTCGTCYEKLIDEDEMEKI